MERESCRRMFLALVILSSVLMTNVAMAPEPTATMYVNPPIIYDTSLTSGSTFLITLEITDVMDLFAWEARLSWEPALLNVSTVVEGPFLKGQPEGSFFVKKINETAGYVDMGCSTVGAYPGVYGGGVLARITLLVEQAGETALELSKAKILDHNLEPMPLLAESGYFSNALPEPADLVGRSAWPAKHHFVISKHGDIQTLYGRVKNLGNGPTLVKVRFSGMLDGEPFETETEEYVLAAGESVDLSASLNVAALGPGKYLGTAQAWCKYYSAILSMPFGPWMPADKTKTVRFAVVP